MAFSSDFLKDARLGRMSLDCREMVLKPNNEECPVLVRGSGHIKQNEQGWLEFKIFAIEHQNLYGADYLSGKYDPKPGELYQHHHYYTLTADDFWGRRWKAGRIKLRFDSSFVTSPPFVIARGTFFEMESHREDERATADPDHRLELAIYQEVEIPFNASTSYFEAINESDPKLRRSTLNRAEFDAAGCKFTAQKEPGVLLVSVRSPDPIPEHFETRIIEGLAFVLGRTLPWNESKRCYGVAEHIRLRSRFPEAKHALMKPPIVATPTGTLQEVWALFDMYLRFIGGTEGPDPHPCSAYLFAVIHASEIGIDSFALVLAVAVEGLVRTLYKDLGAKDANFERVVEVFKNYVLGWPDLKDQGEGVGLNHKRLSDLVGNLKHVSPQDRMYLLADEGYLVREHINLWKRVRRLKAHALEDPNSLQMQKLVDEVHTLIVLLYHLIFYKIGYEGVYTDYSARGRPPKKYPPRPSWPANPEDVAARDPG